MVKDPGRIKSYSSHHDRLQARLVKSSSKVRLGNGHAHGVGDTLAERAGRYLDTEELSILWVSGGLGSELAEPEQ